MTIPKKVNEAICMILECQDAPLHVFRSGGGLRVARLGRYYGEAPTLEESLRILADDIEADSRAYEDVYGPIEPHYLTGTSEASSPADGVILQGGTIDAEMTDEGFIKVSLNGWNRFEVPDCVKERALRGGLVEYVARGIRYSTRATTFADGEPALTTSVAEAAADGRGPFMWRAARIGYGITLADAVRGALASPPMEVAPSTLAAEVR